ncbi:GNAT family N-acetyltransferase [Kitasatospora sp. NPDC006786]|uniref:GNAT family N-acetyltransferase n=1 Tax=unclassified Kitasatospora TaxID=2633591 RepID=UPI0033E856C0
MAKRKGTRGGSTPPRPITGQRLLDGWDGPDGGRIRLARAGEAPAVEQLLDLTGVGLDRIHADSIDTGGLAATLRVGLDGGQKQLTRAAATAAAGHDLVTVIPGLSLVLVAEDQDGEPVGALSAVPPASLLKVGAEQGVQGEQLLFFCLVIAKIGAVAVADSARGRGWGTHLLKRAVQVYQQLQYQLLYGQFDADSEPLPRFYSQRGFTPLSQDEGIDLNVLLGLPLGIQPGPDERLFTRWRR